MVIHRLAYLLRLRNVQRGLATRSMIIDLLDFTIWKTTTDIANKVPVTATTVAYHLRNMEKEDVVILAQFCRDHLRLDGVKLDNEYGYSSVPLCVIDAVFSIGVRYSSTEKTVSRFCEYFDIPKTSHKKLPSPEEQLSVSKFLKIYDEYGIDGMVEQVYRNRQRTSTRNGILKSEAVYKFSKVLAEHGVEYLQDINRILGNEDFEAEITQIPGQRSGISLRYFYMLAGSEDFIKPDRMINRFVYSALERRFGIEETTELLLETCKILAKEHPGLRPRTLDNIIWQYQRKQ